jgi:hypothetical protein
MDLLPENKQRICVNIHASVGGLSIRPFNNMILILASDSFMLHLS